MTMPASPLRPWRPADLVVALALGLALTIRVQGGPRDDKPADDPAARLRQRLEAQRDRARKLAEPFVPKLDYAAPLRDQIERMKRWAADHYDDEGEFHCPGDPR